MRASALGCLLAKAWLTPDDVAATLAGDDARLVRLGLELAENFADKLTPELQSAIERGGRSRLGISRRPAMGVDRSRSQKILQPSVGSVIIAARSSDDPWVVKAFSLLHQPSRPWPSRSSCSIVGTPTRPLSPEGFAEVEQCVSKLWSVCSVQDREALAISRLQAMLDNDRQRIYQQSIAVAVQFSSRQSAARLPAMSAQRNTTQPRRSMS